AAVVTLGFLAATCPDPARAGQDLAPLVSVVAASVLACGLLVHRELEPHRELAVPRAAGTAVALLGAAGMLLALALAWPRPEALAVVGALNFGLLTWAAFRYRAAPAHAPALLCLAVGYLAAFHLGEDFGDDPLSLLVKLGSMTAALELAALALAA